MLIYLYGADTYRRGKKLQEIVTAYSKKHGGESQGIFYMDEKDSLAKLSNFLESQSLFDVAKLAVVYGADEEPKSAALIKKFLEDKKTTIVVLSLKKLPKEFAFLLKKPALAQEFSVLEATELYTFIKTEAKERNITLTSDILASLSNIFQSDTWGIVTELEKIALGGSIEQKMSTPAFFPLVQMLKKRSDMTTRIRALGHLLETEDPVAIFNITAAIVDEDLKIVMADYDIAIKSGKLEYEEALTKLALGNF